MSKSIILGCDRNNPSEDRKTQEYIAKKLEKAGFTVEIIPVGPNYCQSYGQKSSSSGKICVMLINGIGTATCGDFSEGIGRYYHYSKILFAGQAWMWKTQTCEAFKKPTNEHDWNGSAAFKAKYASKSFDKICKESNGKCDWCCAKDKDKLAKAIINKLKGGSSSDDEGDSASSIKDALKELLSYWDGEVECRIEGKDVYVNKIPAPTDDLKLTEGVNIVADSLNIHDYFPDTVNFLTVHWKGDEDIVYRDEKLIARFGEKPEEMDAMKRVTVTKTEETDSTSTDTTSTDSTNSTTTKTTTEIEEVPVETLEEAQTFAETEWAKIRRENGHSIECKVIPSPDWKQGKWCKVNIPSFNEDCFMYITKVSNTDSGDSDWNANITLVDYPPSFGEYKEEETDEEEEEETEETT